MRKNEEKKEYKSQHREILQVLPVLHWLIKTILTFRRLNKIFLIENNSHRSLSTQMKLPD